MNQALPDLQRKAQKEQPGFWNGAFFGMPVGMASPISFQYLARILREPRLTSKAVFSEDELFENRDGLAMFIVLENLRAGIHARFLTRERSKDILLQDIGISVIDLEPFRKADGSALRTRMGWKDDKVLISTGRLEKEKNWSVLLQAAQKALEKHHNLRVIIIGDGSDKNELEELTKELGIAERVTFTGQLTFDEVILHLKAADIFGFASITETQGLVTMEAMAAGLPVVAVDASGTRDIVDNGKQGYLVPNDPDALAQSLIRLLDSTENMHKFSANALKRAKTFDVKNCTRQLVHVYEQAIKDKRDEQYVNIEEGRKQS